MATDKPRLSISMDEQTYEKVLTYKEEQGIATQSKAIVKIMEMGLEELEKRPINKKAPSLSDEGKKIAEDYLSLDRWGKRVVRSVLDEEKARCEDEARFLENTAPKEEPKVIHLYTSPAAAGFASPVFGQDYEPYTLGPGDPKGAEFAVRLQGDSMEPAFPDGSVVFCNRAPLSDGDIGVFYVDGGSVCKQYHKDGTAVYLFSLNRARADADVMLSPGGNRSFVCQGRVITRRRFPIPER